MRQVLVALVCCCAVATTARAGQDLFSGYGGLIYVRQGDQTIVSVGGGLFPRKMRVTNDTPQGPVVTRFTLPSNFHSPTMPDWRAAAAATRPPGPAWLSVTIPDRYGLLYVEDVRARWESASRLLESPPLPPGQDTTVRLRAVFAVGDKLLIEEKAVVLRAGESTAVTFDGSGAIAVPLPKATEPSGRAASP